jgi:phosphoribosylanthranilate isomerase
MTLFVKLCGIRSIPDLEAAIEAGADAVGMVMTPSPRQVTPSHARALIKLVPDHVLGVAVFHDPSPEVIRRVEAEVAPDLFQAELSSLTGLPADRILPVVVDSVSIEADLDRALEATTRNMVLVDSAARGGTGRSSDWDRLAGLDTCNKVVLAGGLNHHNVVEAISRVRPFGVDVSSGIEASPGEKDPDLMKVFVEAARSAELKGELL